MPRTSFNLALFLIMLINSNSSGQVLWGANAHPIQGGPYSTVSLAHQMVLLKETGLSFYRMDLYDATAKSTTTLTNVLAATQTYGITVLPILIPSPGSYTESAVTCSATGGTSETDAYCGGYTLAHSYATQFPGVYRWELGNEYDIFAMDCGSSCSDGSSYPADYPAATFDIVRDLIHGMLDGLHAVLPSALGIVDASGCHYGFLYGLLQSGVDFDLTGWHWYKGVNEPDITNSQCGQAGTQNFLADLNTLLGGRAIWLTEFNDHTDPLASTQGTWLSETMMPESVADARKYNVQAAFIYQLLDQIPTTTCDLGNANMDTSCEGLADENGNILASGTDVQSYTDAVPTSQTSWFAGRLTLWPNQEVRLAYETSGASLIFESTGNLVVQNRAGSQVWASNTALTGCITNWNCEAIFQSNGNFAIYQGSSLKWQTSTSSTGSILTLSASAPYLYIQNASGTLEWSSGGTFAQPASVNFSTAACIFLPTRVSRLAGGTFWPFRPTVTS
jgi:hypothetical protein